MASPVGLDFHVSRSISKAILLIAGILSGLTGHESFSIVGTNQAHGQTLPTFAIPGFESDAKTLEELHALHHPNAYVDCTLWDGWLPRSSLWASETKRLQYLRSLTRRRIDDDGYVAMQQHRGMAHSDGWPFPAWQQSTGIGFHFSTDGEGWAIQNFRLQAAASTDGWEISGAETLGIDPAQGLQLHASEDTIVITTPPFRCGTIVVPFARIEWTATDLPSLAECSIEWLLEGESDWKPSREVTIPHPTPSTQTYANIPLYRHPEYAGLLTRYRIRIRGASGCNIQLKSLITAIDTRHPITNALFVRGCIDTFLWTKDVPFLKASLPRMRRAIRYALDEFRVETNAHVVVPWVGHDGKSGLVIGSDGKKTLKPGVGVGNNYWDLLPFGAHDAIATMYLADALKSFAALERSLSSHPEWEPEPISATADRAMQHNAMADRAMQHNATADRAMQHNATADRAMQQRLDPDVLDRLVARMRDDFQQRFWDPAKGRFVGWIDRDGKPYDYGFTFVNLEAIDYGMATSEQARSILGWIDGTRVIEGDTSQGADIYRWRFAPRATTKRNIETYGWVWSAPESIAWGDQVQDGGAVLGFSYFDLMARLKTNGPDDAWKRLREILEWFREVQAEGGYRSYYAKPGRGLLQGGGPPGGLGLDQEFLESVMVPQVMLYGFLGFQPTADGYTVHPQLPKDWPSLTITSIRIGNEVIDITAYADGRVETKPTGGL